MNQSDSERIAAVLEKIGYKLSLDEKEADLVVINMCSVRQSAVDRVYGKIENFIKPKYKSQKPKVILTGCILKKDIEKLRDRVDYILPIKSLKSWPKFLKQEKYFYYPNQRDLEFNKKFSLEYFNCQAKYKNNFSAFVPISTGCDNFCSYCVVPYLRGPELSRPAKEIILEVENLIKKGYKEIWLLGQNVNRYRSKSKIKYQKSKMINFSDLLKLINNIPGDFWIRFISSHPKDFSDELIGTMAKCKKIPPYLNLPVQSGDDEILKKMNRFYTVEQYKNLVKKIRRKNPEICLSTDVIVGFPGETKKQFENTVKLFEEMKFDMAYISQYSSRSGTFAFSLKDNVSHIEKERRDKILTEILKKTALENNKKYVGREIKVLVKKKKNEFFIGKSEHYKTVKFQVLSFKIQDLIGNFVKVKIVGALPWGLKGEFVRFL